jgi:phage-related protein
VASRELQVRIVGDPKSLSRALGKSGRDVDKFGSRVKGKGSVALLGLGKGALIAGGVITAVLGVALTKVTQAAMESEKSQALLNAQLTALGKNTPEIRSQIDGVVSSLSNLSGFDDEGLQDAFRTLARNTGDVQGSMKNLAIVTDVARGANISLEQAAKLVSKAANGNTGALARYGIQLEKGATAQEALAALQSKFGGQAEAYGKTTAGATDRLKVAFENLQEEVGARVLPLITRLAVFLLDNLPAAIAAMQQAWTQYGQPTFAALKTAFQNAAEFAEENWPKVKAAAESVMQWYRGTLKPAIDNVVSALTAIWERFGAAITRVATQAFNAAKATITAALKIIQAVVNGVLAAIRGDWDEVWNSLKAIAKAAIDAAVTIIRGQITVVKTIATTLGEGAVDGFKAGIKLLKDKAGDAIDAAKATLSGMPRALFSAAQAIGEGAVDGILSGLSSLAGKVSSLVKGALNAPIRAFNSLSIPQVGLSVRIPGLGPFGGKTIGFSAGPYDLPNVPEFDDGGVMPGRRGQPGLAMLHGGETILPTHKGYAGVTNNFYMPAGLDEQAVAARISYTLRAQQA